MSEKFGFNVGLLNPNKIEDKAIIAIWDSNGILKGTSQSMPYADALAIFYNKICCISTSNSRTDKDSTGMKFSITILTAMKSANGNGSIARELNKNG